MMRRINFSIWTTTVGLLVFIVLCSFNLSFVFLQLYLFGLAACLVWMVITILRNGEPSKHIFDERFYEDADHGPR